MVQVEFDDSIVSFQQLCLVFFSLHDPTQLNRQGNDVGTQYRSGIFFHSTGQQHTAHRLIAELTANNVFNSAIVTAISPATAFYPAEAYHQGYFRQNPQQGYCQVIIAPKLAKFRQQYCDLLKK